jgi:hypothetical protein
MKVRVSQDILWLVYQQTILWRIRVIKVTVYQPTILWRIRVIKVTVSQDNLAGLTTNHLVEKKGN